MNKSERRKALAADAVLKLQDAEKLISDIIDTYEDEKVSAAHPKSGLQMSINTLIKIKRSLVRIK